MLEPVCISLAALTDELTKDEKKCPASKASPVSHHSLSLTHTHTHTRAKEAITSPFPITEGKGNKTAS
jgi:hypothetical protein